MAGKTKDTNKQKKYSYEDYLKLDDGNRYEIIDGDIYDMSPAPSFTHQNISMELSTILHTFFKDKKCRVLAAPFDVRLSRKSKKNSDIINTVQPDISVICDEKKIDEKGCLGAPDMIIEIISPSSASRDHILKKDLYEKHGVKEYWLVDPINHITTIYRLNKKSSYGAAEIFDEKAKVPVQLFDGLVIDFEAVFSQEKE